MKGLILSFISILILLILTSCETMRGVESRQKLLKKIDNKDCITQAIKSVEGVNFLYPWVREGESKSWKGESISSKSYYFIYEIPELSSIEVSSQKGKVPVSQIIITEDNSSNPKFNSISYYNSFGHMNGGDYSGSEKDRAKELIKEIDTIVAKQCKLDAPIPDPTDR